MKKVHTSCAILKMYFLYEYLCKCVYKYSDLRRNEKKLKDIGEDINFLFGGLAT